MGNNEIKDFFNSKIVSYALLDYEIVSEKEYGIATGKKLEVIFNKMKVPIFKMQLYLYQDTSRHLVVIHIGNFVFDGRKVRSNLLKADIRDYKKETFSSMGENNHEYRIYFNDLDQFEKIFECFKSYLPK